MLWGVGKIPRANVFQLSPLVSANKSSDVFAARQPEPGEQEHEHVHCLAAGGDEEDVQTIPLTI